MMVGNGNLLPISSIGSSHIPLHNSSSRHSLLLNNILSVPIIAKNLLSISQRILLKSNLVNGLYHLDLSKLSFKDAALSSSLKSSHVTSSHPAVSSHSNVSAVSFVSNVSPTVGSCFNVSLQLIYLVMLIITCYILRIQIPV